MCLQEKWDRLKQICQGWLDIVSQGETMLDYKQLRSNQGFLVYVTQAYPGMKLYLKEFHLLLESWRGGRDTKGWKNGPDRKDSVQEGIEEKDVGRDNEEEGRMLEEVKMPQMLEELKVAYIMQEGNEGVDGPPTGLMIAVPRFTFCLDQSVTCKQTSR
jgi:hypothetical protein